MRPYISKELDIVKVKKPVGIIYHDSLALAKVYKALHLLLKAITVMLYGLLSHHGTHITPAGRVAYHTGTAAHKCYRLIACHLETLHQAECHKMSHVKAVCSRVKAYIEHSLSFVYHLADFFLVSYLGYQPSCLKFLVNRHSFPPLIL